MCKKTQTKAEDAGRMRRRAVSCKKTMTTRGFAPDVIGYDLFCNMTHTLWILCLLVILAFGASAPCPEGSQVHLSSLRCYWLSETTSSWSDARDSCREVQGGDLAAADSPELRNFLHHSFPVETTVWVWVRSGGEGSDQAGGLEPSSHAGWAGGGCALMALGTLGPRRRTQCAGQFPFLCESLISGVLPSVDSYLTGLAVMSAVYAQTQTRPLLSVPDAGRHTVELQLFPGLWFSHAGQLVAVELVVRLSPLASLARVQILRPYCDPNLHLVPPGCSSLLNPFSCCTAVPLCNTTGGCTPGQYWCHLLDTCVPTTSPCSPYDPATGVRGFELPPRYVGIPPFYHMVADLPLKIDPSSKLKTIKLLLPDQAIMVYPDDIVAIQHTRTSGAFLHCLESEASINSPWRQSYLSLMGAEQEGWWKGGLMSLSQKGQWVDGVACDLRMLYVDNLHRGTEHEDIFGLTKATTAPDISLMTAGASLSPRTKFGLNVIHPLPDEERRIHSQINVPIRIVIKVLSGENVRSSWSAPVLQTGVPFLSPCPEEVISSWPDYKGQLHEAWCSSVTLALPSAGVQTMNITVMDEVSSESLSLIICGYEAVTGLSVEPHGHTRMLVNISQLFIARLETGSSITFRWVIDNLESFAHEGEAYSVLFNKPAEHRLKVTASNPVSSQSQQLLLTVDEMTPLAEPEFLSAKEVIAVNVTQSYRLRVKVDISLPVTFRWDFGDGHGKIINSHPAPCQTMVGLMEGKMKQVYVQDTVNYTYSIPDDYTLYVQVVSAYDSTETSVKLNVRPQLRHIQISSVPLVPFVEQAVLLEASSQPSAHSVFYTWDFGDGSASVQGIDRRVSHAFGYAGIFNVTVCASNNLTALTTWVVVEVMEKISGLTVSLNGPSEVSSDTEFRAKAASGTSLMWSFDFGDGSLRVNQTDGSVAHIYNSPGNYTVHVTVSNAVSKVDQSITVEVYERIDGLQIECQSLTNIKYVPTQEELRFFASITEGSSVSYRWLAVQSTVNKQTTGDGEFFHLLVKSPGEISVQLRASNELDEATSTASLMAVERVTGAQITTQPDTVAFGKLVKISVSVATGSDLEYRWIVDSDTSPLLTQEPFLLHTFASLGSRLVRVSVQNVLSQSNDTKQFTVQQEVEEVNFQIEGKTPPFYISSSVAVPLCGVSHKGSGLHWNWTVTDPESNIFIASNQTFFYSFPLSGTYQVSLNVSNRISWQVVSHRVVVQDRIEGLHVNVSKAFLCAGEEVTFIPSVSRGSKTSFDITFTNKDWTHSQSSVEGNYTTSNLPVGTSLVAVKAWNQVSSEELSTSILVIEHIRGLRLVNCCSAALEALKGAFFKAEVQPGVSVNYTWTFHMRSRPTSLTGQEVFFTPAESGSLSVGVVASNGVCSHVLNESVPVEWPVKKVRLVCRAERIFAGHVVRFSSTVDGGSNLRYHWDFGDYTEIMVTESKSVSHTYHNPGKYTVVVKVLNSVNHTSTQLDMKVEELQCSSPQASLVQSHPTIFRSRPSFFEASVTINCTAYKPVYLWEVHMDSNCTNSNMDALGNQTVLSGNVDAASPLLSLPKNSLRVGMHCLVLTVSLQGTPLLVRQHANVTVLHSPLVAVIKGGSHRLWSSLSDLTLDGSDSKDPDEEPGEKQSLQYHWTCVTANSTEFHFVSQPSGRNSSKITVLGSQLHAGTVYTFTLTVHKRGRTPASASQTVSVSPTPVLPVTVGCVSCSALSSSHLFTYTSTLVLAGQCGQCGDSAQYVWKAESQTGGVLDLDDITTSTGRHLPHLVVHSGVLQPEQRYTFTLNVSQPGRGQWGIASLSILPNNPPHGGLCDLSPESNIRLLETVVTYNCSGWQNDGSDASQLIYSLQVAPCHASTSACPVLSLYRGIRSAFSSLVPTGTQKQGKGQSVISVIVLVEDHLGAKVTALNRTLTVVNPIKNEDATHWLKGKSQNELWALVQRGNPQEIIPYSVVLTNQLNTMQSTQNVRELTDRKKIRENVTQALTSLPMSSMLDVDQISSALAQSTDVPAELECENCHEQILKAVEKMIHLMEDKMIPGALSAFHTGRNILNILGNTLAASSLHSSYWSSLQSASTVALSTLNHTGALMRSLMRSQFHGEAPVFLSNPYLMTAGFHGDPSDLLCTNRLNQPRLHHRSKNPQSCAFHVPNSLTSLLKSQRTEVVQVLIAMDGALESIPLLTAADPPISTGVVAMEINTPQGQPIHIKDLQPEQAIKVTLHRKFPLEQGSGGEAGNGTCFTVTLPTEQLNFTVKTPDELDEHAGLYLSFNFSLAPGGSPATSGHVKIEVSASEPEPNASHNPLVREWDFALSAQSLSTEKTIFLSPLLNETDKPLSVSLATSLVEGGPVRLSLCVFSSVCQYYDMQEEQWSSEGLRPLEGSTLRTVHCLTQHLTMFGASLFVHPGAVVLLQPLAGPVQNVMAGIVCAVLVLIHLLLWLIAHKLDHLDGLRLSQVPLCGRAGLYHYRVLVKTGWKRGAGTSAHVGISLYGVNKSGSRHLQRDGAFQRGRLDQFHLETDENLGDVWKVRVWHDNTGLDPSWYVEHVVVWDAQTDHLYFFLLNDWLSVENERNGTVEQEVLASCPEELTEFWRVLASQLVFGMMERHMWLSLWERPAHSRFTRGQRIGCSAIVLHLYLALGAVWYGAVGSEGHRGSVSAHLLVNMETVAVGMTLALLAFPLQCLLGFLFRKTHSKVTEDMLVSPSPDCHSVEMDIYLGQSGLSSPSFISLSDSSGPIRGTSTSLLESKGINSSILDFWATSGLAPQTLGAGDNQGVSTWSSCDSLINLPLGSDHSKTTPANDLGTASSAVGPSRPLRRKKALMELCPVAPSSTDAPSTRVPSPCKYTFLNNSSDVNNSSDAPGREVLTMRANQIQVHNHNLATFLTLSEEDLLMSIAAATEDRGDSSKSNSDSGWDSPRTTSSLSTAWSNSYSSCSDQSEDTSLYGANPKTCPSLYGTRLYKCPSVNSVASTFLPSPSPDSACSSSTTRIGVARRPPSWLLPRWALWFTYPLVVVLLGASLAVIGLFGSFFPRSVVLMWLVSALCAFLTSAVLLEPLKVSVQALIYTILWRPVDPEVEEQLAQETTVVRAFGEHCKKVRPPCGYGLLQAKQEARKVQALRSLMRHCLCQMLFLMLVLMVNYQDSVEQSQGRLLRSSIRRGLHATPEGGNNLTSLRDWSDVEQWIGNTLVQHFHQTPSLRLAGSPRLRYTRALSAAAGVVLGNGSEMTQQLLAGLHMADWSKTMFKTLCIDFTHYHRQSGLFVCVSLHLAWDEAQRVSPSLFIHPLLIPSSFSGMDLQVALTVLLLIAALLVLFVEMWSMATERAQYVRQCKHWLQLLLALLSLATAILHLSFLSLASSCLSKLQSQPDGFISFHSAALQAQRSSQCAAVLLTVVLLKMLRTLRFVRRWVVIGRVLQRAWRQLRAFIILLLLLLLLCAHLGEALFSRSVEGFLSAREAAVSVLSMLRGRRALQKICSAHPALGPLYGLLLTGGVFWLLARLCGAVLIHTYREERVELYHPTIEPQDYEMVEFFIKRLKLWMGLTKAREFRHRVTFEGMGIPPSRSSQESRLSTASSTLHFSLSPSLYSSVSSPCSLSSVLSATSGDLSASEPAFDVQPYCDRLLPRVDALLSQFDRVNQITQDVHYLEMKLEEAQTRRRTRRIINKGKSDESLCENLKEQEGEGRVAEEVRRRKTGVFYPRQRVSLPSCFPFNMSTIHSSAASNRIFLQIQNSHTDSDSVLPQVSSSNHGFETTNPASGIHSLCPAGSLEFGRFPRRRAWHSGSSHSADAAQRAFLLQGGAGPCLTPTSIRPRSEEGLKRRISDGFPVKRKAWISEQD